MAPDALRTAGEDKAARKRYVALIDADPTLTCAQEGLTTLNKPAAD